MKRVSRMHKLFLGWHSSWVTADVKP